MKWGDTNTFVTCLDNFLGFRYPCPLFIAASSDYGAGEDITDAFAASTMICQVVLSSIPIIIVMLSQPVIQALLSLAHVLLTARQRYRQPPLTIGVPVFLVNCAGLSIAGTWNGHPTEL